MSSKLAMRVLESDLSADLRLVTTVLALFGNDAGERIYPSVARVAHLAGKSRRAVEKQMARLRSMGVLVPITGEHGGRLPGGRGRSVLYSLDVEALPQRSTFAPIRSQLTTPPNPVTRDGVEISTTPSPTTGLSDEPHPNPVTNDTNTPSPETRTPSPATQYPVTGDGRTLDRTEERTRERTGDQDLPPLRVGSLAERTEKKSTEEPEEPQATENDPDFRVYAAVATEALNRSLREMKSDAESDVSELFKVGCAQHRPPLPYNSDIAARAVRAVLGRRRKAQADFHKRFREVAGVRPMGATA
jgi:biotin operon repressor